MKSLRYLRDVAVFAPCYVLLDWVSYIAPLGPFNITPWSPQPALAVVWMLLGGLGHAPAVFGTIVLADLVVRDVPAGYAITATTAAALAAGYAFIAWALRTLLRPRPNLHSLRQLTIFVSVVVPATAVIAGSFVGILYAAGQLAANAMLFGWLRFWVGDAVGILVTAPLLLVVADPERRRNLIALARRAETYLQVAVVGVALWLIFKGLGGDPSHHFYLLFLPLIWVAVRTGMGGAIVAIAIIQLGVVLGIHGNFAGTFPVIELQALVAGLTLTGLYLGVMMDERERAEDSLKQSLRLAAAGEMAGAITHEVSQPLTALANYGRSARLLVEAGRTAELGGVVDKMLGEAQRASDVVRRLRDFFREGTTRLEEVPVAGLLESARQIGESMKGTSEISFAVNLAENLPPLLVDRLQIELVLRNIVANAVEAIGSQSASRGRVSMSATRQNAGYVRITVSDSGPGIPVVHANRVFEPFVSGKSTGMGLGLAVSRAIAEAHGGQLEASPGSHGEFHLILPVEAARA